MITDMQGKEGRGAEGEIKEQIGYTEIQSTDGGVTDFQNHSLPDLQFFLLDLLAFCTYLLVILFFFK